MPTVEDLIQGILTHVQELQDAPRLTPAQVQQLATIEEDLSGLVEEIAEAAAHA